MINLAPSAGNMQSYHIYAVKNKEIKEKMAEISHQKFWMINADCILAFCAIKGISAKKF